MFKATTISVMIPCSQISATSGVPVQVGLLAAQVLLQLVVHQVNILQLCSSAIVLLTHKGCHLQALLITSQQKRLSCLQTRQSLT